MTNHIGRPRIRHLSIDRHNHIIANHKWKIGTVSMQLRTNTWFGEFTWNNVTYTRLKPTKEKLLTALKLAAINRPTLVVDNTAA